MELNLEGKHALVCGSSKGIGKAIAIGLSKLGAGITLMARSADMLSTVVGELENKTGQHHRFQVADFSDLEDVRKKACHIIDAQNIHILINNTGGPAGGPLLDAQPEEFLKAINNHILCSQLLTQLAVPGMKASNYGRIINVISTSVKTPIPNLGVSNTIRGAMANWSKTMAAELAPFGITVNNVLPGFTATGRLKEVLLAQAEQLGIPYETHEEKMRQSVPMKRFGHPEEVANAAVFLASPAASYITGTNITVDGGRTPCY